MSEVDWYCWWPKAFKEAEEIDQQNNNNNNNNKNTKEILQHKQIIDFYLNREYNNFLIGKCREIYVCVFFIGYWL